MRRVGGPRSLELIPDELRVLPRTSSDVVAIRSIRAKPPGPGREPILLYLSKREGHPPRGAHGAAPCGRESRPHMSVLRWRLIEL